MRPLPVKTEDSINSFDYTVEILMLRMSTKELPLGYYRINYTPVDTTKVILGPDHSSTTRYDDLLSPNTTKP